MKTSHRLMNGLNIFVFIIAIARFRNIMCSVLFYDTALEEE